MNEKERDEKYRRDRQDAHRKYLMARTQEDNIKAYEAMRKVETDRLEEESKLAGPSLTERSARILQSLEEMDALSPVAVREDCQVEIIRVLKQMGGHS